jgi:hypothetical protein
MDLFLQLDKHIRDAYVAGDKDKLLAIAGTLSLYADETCLRWALQRAEDYKVAEVPA